MSLLDLLRGITAPQEIENKEFEDGAEVPDEFLKHEHLRGIRVFSVNPSLPCGSQYFVRLNSFSLGFADLEEFSRFRNEINSMVSEIITKDTSDPEPASCLVCGKEVGVEDGFRTTIGWMHEQCNQEQANG